jgi:hypothetical protein
VYTIALTAIQATQTEGASARAELEKVPA